MEQEIVQLKQRIQFLENTISNLSKSDRYIFQKTVQVLDGRNVQLGVSTGTKIGTATTQKIGFYNKAPVAQQTGVAVSAAGVHAALVNLGLITA